MSVPGVSLLRYADANAHPGSSNPSYDTFLNAASSNEHSAFIVAGNAAQFTSSLTPLRQRYTALHSPVPLRTVGSNGEN